MTTGLLKNMQVIELAHIEVLIASDAVIPV